jgi:hypothetical protein
LCSTLDPALIRAVPQALLQFKLSVVTSLCVDSRLHKFFDVGPFPDIDIQPLAKEKQLSVHGLHERLYSMASLQNLPDELILGIIQQLSCIRSYETQSTAFRDREGERARQCENRLRQLALHALCMTSRKLRAIATPLLYSSFTGSLTWYGLKPLQLFRRTITAPDAEVCVGRRRLIEYLQYVENRLADHLGNSLSQDSSRHHTRSMATEYLCVLASIVTSARNLQHLNIVSLETKDISFWSHILPHHGIPPFQRLHSVCAQIHTYGNVLLNDKVASFHSICTEMTSAPLLVDLRASGLTPSSWAQSFQGSFKELQRLELTECCLDIDNVLEIWEACEGLQHIACEWAFLLAVETAPKDLYAGLLRHKNTLKTLHLDMREVRFDDAFIAPAKLGSLQPFAALESVRICETTLFGNVWSLACFPEQVIQCRITELLPASLNTFALLVLGNQDMEDVSRLDEPLILWNFVEDCQRDFPELRVVRFEGCHDLYAPRAAKAFEEIGVQFELIKQPRHGASQT